MKKRYSKYKNKQTTFGVIPAPMRSKGMTKNHLFNDPHGKLYNCNAFIATFVWSTLVEFKDEACASSLKHDNLTDGLLDDMIYAWEVLIWLHSTMHPEYDQERYVRGMNAFFKNLYRLWY